MRRDDPAVASPCIRHCTLDERDVCLGCRRTIDEIKEWGQASEPRKREILRISLARQSWRTRSRADGPSGG